MSDCSKAFQTLANMNAHTPPLSELLCLLVKLSRKVGPWWAHSNQRAPVPRKGYRVTQFGNQEVTEGGVGRGEESHWPHFLLLTPAYPGALDKQSPFLLIFFFGKYFWFKKTKTACIFWKRLLLGNILGSFLQGTPTPHQSNSSISTN